MKTLKSIWLTACYPLLYLAMQLVISGAYSLVASVFGVFMAALTNPRAYFDDSANYADVILRSFDLQVPLVISSLLMLLSIYFINRWKWRETGFLRLPKGSGANLRFAAAVGVLGSALLNILLEILDVMRYFPDYEEVMEIAMGGSPVLRVLAMIVLAPLVEELIFRGLILSHLRTRMKAPFAILISSVIFGVIHLNVLQGVYATLLGALFAIIYYRSGTIWAAVCAHMGFNAVSTLATVFIDTPLVGGSVMMILYALSIACVVERLVSMRRRRRHQSS